ncbi:hypothetical protein HPB50_024761 [Hyalomma asiaticum]|uniref:Uncharacterized protein n=1 Tax=Hyalomma asiaticum TaxID=266040 RepID=A0ACB7T5B3_HYAAI|nr:hypothetical protein HPB50_024761 [Hyalomma asiaticum]
MITGRNCPENEGRNRGAEVWRVFGGRCDMPGANKTSLLRLAPREESIDASLDPRSFCGLLRLPSAAEGMPSRRRFGDRHKLEDVDGGGLRGDGPRDAQRRLR